MSSEQGQGSVDAATIEKTKQQIRGLVQEIAQLSRGDLAPDQYYGEVMQRIVTALAALGGAVWTINAERQLRLDYQMNLSQHLLDPKSEDSRRHVRLLQEVITSGEPRLVPPLSGTGDPDGAGNPTNTLLVLAPLKTEGEEVEGVLEVFQRPDAQANSQQGYRRFLMQMSDLVGDWLKSRKLRHFSDRQSIWAKIDQFSKEIHNSLDPKDTAYTIANEGRRLIGCDRVSVTKSKGPKQVVEAVSGQDTMDERSNLVTMLGALATRVCATGEPLWYNGSLQDLPPQVESALEAYVDESHTKSLAVLPLFKTDMIQQKNQEELGAEQQEKYQSDRGDVIGSIIIEQIDSVQSRDVIAPRADLVCQHSARALGNAIEHDSVFLMPLWRNIGKSRVLVTARYLPKTLLVSGLIIGVLLAMLLIPKKFELKADGNLEPVHREFVYFATNGEVVDVPAEHGMDVSKGDLLIELENSELNNEITGVRAQLNSSIESKNALDQQITKDKDRDGTLIASSIELAEKIIGYRQQLAILEERVKKLQVRSPVDGQVVSWDIQNRLRGRPVNIGQLAVEVDDLSGPWELEVYLADKRIGHLLKGQRDAGKEDLPVTFVIKSHSGESFKGELVEVQDSASVHEVHGHSYRMRIAFNKEEVLKRLNLSELSKGTEVVAKIEVGHRSMAYCFFHELVEWLQVRLFAL